MTRLTLASPTDLLELDGIERDGVGFQAQSGLSGLGLPPKQVQWMEGAGDGAIARGRRTLPRDIDVPLHVLGANPIHLRELLSRLAKVLAGSGVLTVIDDDGVNWTTGVEHVGGGSYVYGVNTVGGADFSTVLTLRAGDPYFMSTETVTTVIGQSTSSRGLLGGGSLAAMRISTSQAIGTIALSNEGDVFAYPVWTVIGPGRNFKAISPSGELLNWTGVLGADQSLVIDTRRGTVIDQSGANRYADLAAAPRFWTIGPGQSTSTASLEDIDDTTQIICEFSPRKWMVI